MKRLILFAALAATTLTAAPVAEAKKRYYDDDRIVVRHRDRDRDDDDWRDRDRDRDHWRHRDRSRTIYVIENRRPVRRVVYVDDSGGYYRYIDGRRSYVRGRYFTSYPSRYFYSDGRPRVGVSINF